MSSKRAITLIRANWMSGNARDKNYCLSHTVVQSAWWRLYSNEKSAEKLKPQTAAPETPVPDAGNATPKNSTDDIKKITEEVESLTQEIKGLQEQNDNLMDKYKRALAESENLRVRLTKQIADAKVFGIQSFCKDLLEVADTLGHATDSVPTEQLNGSNPQLKNLYDGLVMTKASMLQVFKRHGLEQINPIRQKFDPNMHEALFQKEETDVEPNTVIAVTKLGYKLHERCIRPALVGVSKTA